MAKTLYVVGFMKDIPGYASVWEVILKDVFKKDVNVLISTPGIMEMMKNNDDLNLIFSTSTVKGLFWERLIREDGLLLNTWSNNNRVLIGKK